MGSMQMKYIANRIKDLELEDWDMKSKFMSVILIVVLFIASYMPVSEVTANENDKVEIKSINLDQNPSLLIVASSSIISSSSKELIFQRM